MNLTPMLELATAFLTPDTPTTIDTDALIVTALAAIDETLADPHFE